MYIENVQYLSSRSRNVMWGINLAAHINHHNVPMYRFVNIILNVHQNISMSLLYIFIWHCILMIVYYYFMSKIVLVSIGVYSTPYAPYI